MIFFYETPAIVVIEQISGIEAIKRSFEIGKKHFGHILLITIIVSFATGIATIGFLSIHYVWIQVFLIANLFLAAWNSMTPAIFYYEYEGMRI